VAAARHDALTIARLHAGGEADEVKVSSPTWELCSPCPCCGQGGLEFSSCRRCHNVVLICAEVGTVFPDPHDLTCTLAQSSNDEVKCPSCGSASVADYENATSDQIRALGFTPDQYR